MKSIELYSRIHPSNSHDFAGLHELVLENSHVGIVVCDSNGIIRYMNQRYAETYNLDRFEALGNHITTYFPNAQIPRIAKTGKADVGVRFSWKGQEAIVHRTPILVNGEIKWVVAEVIIRDINELKELATKMHLLEEKVDYYKQKIREIPGTFFTLNDMIGDSPAIRGIKEKAQKFAQSSEPVLILGESGTGKEMLAHGIHSSSSRANELFVKVNCASIPKDLLESELFGYEEGAFTGAIKKGKIGKFELADHGTIFLDEIGDLPLEMQAKILRVIEYKEIERIGATQPLRSDFRLIAATNKDLEDLVDKGFFRGELYFRLNVLVLRIPSLRDRIQDLPSLSQYFLGTAADRTPGRNVRVGKEVKMLFQDYFWPGNVRELRNVINSCLNSLEIGQDTIEVRHLPGYLQREALFKPKIKTTLYPLRQSRDLHEREVIQNVLSLTSGNKAKASRLLGISRNAFYKKIKKYTT
jgi:PAS domain S-box-containing protein